MGSISKHLFDKVCHTNCDIISHPWSKGCWKGFLGMWISSFYGSAKFYLLIYLAQSVIKNRKITIEVFIETLSSFLREASFGAFMGSGFVGGMCIFRHTLRKFGYYTIAFIPAAIGGSAIFLVESSRRGVSITTFQYLALEILYRYFQFKGIFKDTVMFETLFFMACSSGLLYLLRKGNNCSTFLWFFTPPKVKLMQNEESQPCPHDGPCLEDISSGFKRYFLFGFILQLVRRMLPKLKKLLINPLRLFKLLTSIDTYLLGLYTGSYVLFYKVMSCLLCRWHGHDSATFAIPSGFLAGITYAIQPNLPIALIALTNFIKIYMEQHKIDVKLLNLPWQELSFIVSAGIIFHVRTMHPQICPKHAINLMSSMTGRRSDHIYSAFKNCTDALLQY